MKTLIYEFPRAFDQEEPSARTLLYCAVYDNGAAAKCSSWLAATTSSTDVALDAEAQVQERLRQQLPVLEEQRHEQVADAV